MNRADIEKKGIGSSEAAAVLGIDSRKTQLQLFLEKTGVMVSEFQGNDDTAWGKLNEPALARYWEYKNPGKCLVEDNEPHFSQQYPFMFASPDFRCIEDELIVECKRTGLYQHYGEAGTDSIPEPVIIQVHHQMIVTGWRKCEVIAQIGRFTPSIYPIPFDEELAAMIVDAESEFWRLVCENRRPHEIQANHPQTLRVLKRLFNTVNSERVLLDSEQAITVLRWKKAKEFASRLEKRIAALESEVLSSMGEAGFGLMPDGERILRIARSRSNPAREAKPDSKWIETKLVMPRTPAEQVKFKEEYNDLYEQQRTRPTTTNKE